MRLLEFEVSNYGSFYEPQKIEFDQGRNVFAVYGPNGAGKTNLLKAFRAYCDFIKFSTSFSGRAVSMRPFLLNESGEKEPTRLSAKLADDAQKIYEYGFSIYENRVQEEYLILYVFSDDVQKKTTIFRRPSVNSGRFKEYGFDSELLKRTRDDSLLLTKAWENNNSIAKDFFALLDSINLVLGSSNADGVETSRCIAESEKFKEDVLKLLKASDLSIQDIAIEKAKIPDDLYHALDLPGSAKESFLNMLRFRANTVHLVRNKDTGKPVKLCSLSMDDQESKGTQRIYALAKPILDTIENGGVLYIDEFEAYLHPNECEFLISLFSSNSNNPHNAQLIINTHATQLIDPIGRDGIYFIGKDRFEQSVIGTIPKSVRPQEHSLEKRYRKGMFGAIPNITRL